MTMIKVRSLPPGTRFYLPGVSAVLEVSALRTSFSVFAVVIDVVTDKPFLDVFMQLSLDVLVELVNS